MRFQAQRWRKGKALPFLTSALERDGWSTARVGRFTPGEMFRHVIHRRMGGPQGLPGRVWREENISHPPGFELRTVQPIAVRYTDYDILDPQPSCIVLKYLYERSELLNITLLIVILSKLIQAERLYQLKDDVMKNSTPCFLIKNICSNWRIGHQVTVHGTRQK